MKIIFFGSDHFSLSSLEACRESGHAISLIVTTPPQKKGRGLEVTASPVQLQAETFGIPFIAPADLKAPEILERITAEAPDFYVVSSYGIYIPSAYLSIPRAVSLNVHPSLLPLYRGSSPIQYALLNGDRETGVSIIEVAKKLDAGDIFRQVRLDVDPRDDYLSLSQKLAALSRRVLGDVLASAAGGALARMPQDETLATLTRKMEKEDGRLRWEDLPEIFDRKVRALRPWPGTFVSFENNRLAVLDAEPAAKAGDPVPAPGVVMEIDGEGGMTVAVQGGAIRILRVQLAGKNPVSARDFANGRRIKPGFSFARTP